jgi:hypothetical protein
MSQTSQFMAFPLSSPPRVSRAPPCTLILAQLAILLFVAGTKRALGYDRLFEVRVAVVGLLVDFSVKILDFHSDDSRWNQRQKYYTHPCRHTTIHAFHQPPTRCTALNTSTLSRNATALSNFQRHSSASQHPTAPQHKRADSPHLHATSLHKNNASQHERTNSQRRTPLTKAQPLNTHAPPNTHALPSTPTHCLSTPTQGDDDAGREGGDEEATR